MLAPALAILWGLVGCGGGDASDAAGSSPSVAVPSEGTRGEGTSAVAPVTPGTEAGVQALRDAMAGTLQPCRTVAAPQNAEPSDDPDAVESACGPAAGVYAEHRAILGTTRQGDQLLGVAARVHEDVAFLVRALQSGKANRVQEARAHLSEALGAVTTTLDRVRAVELQSYAKSYGAAKDWPFTLERGEASVGGLHEHLDRYAFQQGLNPDMVRGALLEVFVGQARAEHAGFVAGIEAAEELEASERAARQAYLDATGAYLDVVETAMQAYLDGEVTSPADREAIIARVEAAHATWRAAWQAESSRSSG